MSRFSLAIECFEFWYADNSPRVITVKILPLPCGPDRAGARDARGEPVTTVKLQSKDPTTGGRKARVVGTPPADGTDGRTGIRTPRRVHGTWSTGEGRVWEPLGWASIEGEVGRR